MEEKRQRGRPEGKVGRYSMEPKTQVNVSIEKKLLARLDQIQAELGISRSTLMNRALFHFFEQIDKKEIELGQYMAHAA